MISLMILVIIVPLFSLPKPDNPSSGSTHINGADGLITTDPDPTLIPARDLMMASSSLTRDSSATRDRASDCGSTELSGGYSAGDRAMTSSQNPTESPPPVSAPTVGVQEPVQTTTTTRGDITGSCTTTLFLKGKIFLIYMWNQITKIKRILDMMHSAAASASSSTTGPLNLENKSLILAFEAALALINIRFQALGNSSSGTSLSSFLVTMVAATTIFAFTSTLIGLMLEGIHQAVATVCSCAGLISVVLGFFFMVATFIPERFIWLVWVSGGVLVVVFVYSLAKRTCNTAAASSTPSSV